jgi:hypothetical protein
LEETIDNAIKKMLLGQPATIPLGKRSRENELSNRIVHSKVGTPSYTQFELIMATEYAMGKFLETFRDQEEHDLKYYLRLLEDIPFATSTVRQLFEHYASRQLSKGGEFLARSLDDGLEKMHFSPTKPQMLKKPSECTNPTIYCTPGAKNFP